MPNEDKELPILPFEIGSSTLEQSIETAECICRQEKRRRQLDNEAEITECQAALKFLYDERRELLPDFIAATRMAARGRWQQTST